MSKITFQEWHDRWWPTILNSDRAPSTITGYESSLRRHVLPHLASCRLKELRRIDVEEWLTDLRSAGYSNSTIHAARTAAGMVLTSAVDSRITSANPLTGVRLPKGSSRTRKALTAEQVEDVAALVDPW
jgi:site-specific recombinase XerD